MKRRLAAVLAATLLTVVAGPGHAATKPIPEDGVTLDEVRAWLQSEGYRAALRSGADGSRYIETGADGVNLFIYLENCVGQRCPTFEIFTSFDSGKEPPSLQKINKFNNETRFVRAFVVDKAVAFELRVLVAPGGSWELLGRSFAVFTNTLPDVKKLLGL